jgi:hypothetical protein
MNELKVGDRVTIRYSKKLEQNGNSLLTNRTGIVTRILFTGGNLTGAYVDVKVMRRVRNYYIPISSIEGPDLINKMRTLSILKSTVL